jgi:predicted aspartyl protease
MWNQRSILCARIIGFWFCRLFIAGNSAVAEERRILLEERLASITAQFTTNASINGQPCLMLVDTGASETAIDSSFRKHVGDEVDNTTAYFSDGKTITQPRYHAEVISAQSLIVQNPKVLVIDFRQIAEFVGLPVKGALGMDAISKGKLLLDFDGKSVVISSGSWTLTNATQEVDLDKMAVVPTIDVSIGGHRAQFVIDTGSNGGVTLEKALFDELVKAGDIKPVLTGGSSISAVGEAKVRSGRFVRGNLMGKRLEGFSVDAAPRGFLGMCWLCGFNIEIDFPERKLRYVERPNAAPPLDIQSMVGAIFMYDDVGARVERLKPGGGAAETAGLQVGDTIVSLDGMRRAEMNIATVAEAVTAKAGKEIEIRFLRPPEDIPRVTKLRLPPPISEWPDLRQGDGSTDKVETSAVDASIKGESSTR